MSTFGNFFRSNARFSIVLSRNSLCTTFRMFHLPSKTPSGCRFPKNLRTITQSVVKARQSSLKGQLLKLQGANFSRCMYFRSNLLYPKFRGFHISSRREAWPIAALLVKLLGPLSKISKLAAMLAGRLVRGRFYTDVYRCLNRL